jgi:hypothetical protein
MFVTARHWTLILSPLSAIGSLRHPSSPIPHWSTQVYLDRRLPYITCYISDRGLFIALMKEAVCTPETSVYLNVITRRYIPKNSKLHTRCCGNLKSHTGNFSSHLVSLCILRSILVYRCLFPTPKHPELSPSVSFVRLNSSTSLLYCSFAWAGLLKASPSLLQLPDSGKFSSRTLWKIRP